MKQSILKSILNQHNISQSSSRYFKIIERCSNGFLHIRFLIAFKRFDPGLKCNVAQRKNLFDGSSVYYRTRHTHTQKKSLEYCRNGRIKSQNRFYSMRRMYTYMRHYPFQYLRKCVKPFWLKAKVLWFFLFF